MTSHFSENGFLMMMGACVFFAIFDGLTKHLTNSWSPGQIAVVRFAFGAVVMFPTLFREKLWQSSRDFSLLVLRGVLGAGTFYVTLLAFKMGTLSVTMVLFFTNPLWSLFLSAYFLDEHLTWKRVVGVTIAVLGIGVLINPLGEGVSVSHFLGIAAGVMGGGNNVLTRHLRSRHSARVIYAFQCLVGVICTLPTVVGHLDVPGVSSGSLLLVAAVFGLLGQVTMNHGFRYIGAAEGGMLLMFEAILTSALGIVLFREPLTLHFVLGSAMILGSGIYLGWRQDKNVVGIDGDSLSVSE